MMYLDAYPPSRRVTQHWQCNTFIKYQHDFEFYTIRISNDYKLLILVGQKQYEILERDFSTKTISVGGDLKSATYEAPLDY